MKKLVSKITINPPLNENLGYLGEFSITGQYKNNFLISDRRGKYSIFKKRKMIKFFEIKKGKKNFK